VIEVHIHYLLIVLPGKAHVHHLLLVDHNHIASFQKTADQRHRDPGTRLRKGGYWVIVGLLLRVGEGANHGVVVLMIGCYEAHMIDGYICQRRLLRPYRTVPYRTHNKRGICFT
jgi:hypothetical protein